MSSIKQKVNVYKIPFFLNLKHCKVFPMEVIECASSNPSYTFNPCVQFALFHRS